MNYLRILFLLAIHSLFAISRLPDEFTVTERVFSLTSTFDVATDLGPFAKVCKRFFSPTSSFDLEDAEGRPLASAQSSLFSWGTKADVLGSDGRKIGKIEEEVWKILPWAEYKVFDENDQLIAIARMNVWGTHFDLFHPSNPNHIYASIERPFIRIFRDVWTVQIRDYLFFEEKIMDPRLLVMLVVYQTDKENRDRMRSALLQQLIDEQNEFEGTRIGDF